MMKGDKNTSVLTTYGEVSAIGTNLSADRTEKTLTRMEQNIYAQAGVASQIFASTGSSSLETSINNDVALMMYLANKFSRFVTCLLNDLFANSNVSFKYVILPITYYNTASYVDTTFKLVGSGYSALLPALALGMSQKDLVSVKDLENDLLKLGEKLKPLSTSYTQSASPIGEEDSEEGNGEEPKKQQVPGTEEEEGGRPKKKEEEKAEKTIKNEESLDKTGGS